MAPKNSHVASLFTDEQDPKPSETSDITDAVSSESEDELQKGGGVVCFCFWGQKSLFLIGRSLRVEI